MTRPLCAAPRCRTIGHHTPDCDNGECRGCQPRLAADGLRLCHIHTRDLATDAYRAVEVYTELALALTRSDRPGERTTGTRDPGLIVNERAVEARSTIRHTLVAWCRLIADERGIGLPADDIHSMARYIARHAEWLAAHPAAGDCSAELRELAHGEPWRIAYPTGSRVFEVGPCPETVDGQPCPGVVRAVLRRTDSLLPSELVCDWRPDPVPDGWTGHRWPASEWLTLGRKLRRAA